MKKEKKGSKGTGCDGKGGLGWEGKDENGGMEGWKEWEGRD